MRRPMFAAAAAVVMAAALSIPSALQAHDAGSGRSEGGSMMGPGMGNMSQMMDHCSRMMQEASGKPNEQWRDGSPPAGGQDEKRQ